MSSFDVKIQGLKMQADHFGEISESLMNQANQLEKINGSLKGIGLGALNTNFLSMVMKLRKRSKKVSELQNALYRIIALFLEAEQTIMGWESLFEDIFEEIREKIDEYYNDYINVEEFEIDSIVFDDEGLYGGAQGHPQNATEEELEALYSLICSNNPDHEFTPTELEAYLVRASSEGCGYIAMTNSIFVAFADNPEAFEEAFGYPMYGENGDLNYDMLFIDLYSSMDNINPDTGEFDYYHDYNSKMDGEKEAYDFWTDTSGTGTNTNNRKYAYEQFLSEHGVSAEYHQKVDVTPSNVQSIIESGETIIISYHNGQIYDVNGKPQEIHGHAMVITGVTDDGKYIVSSWGEEYYLDPKENTGDTYMYYDTTSIVL